MAIGGFVESGLQGRLLPSEGSPAIGTNKRYARQLDERMQERIAEVAARPPEPRRRRWKPPWPPIHIGVGEWIIMRDSNREPVGVIRTVKLGPREKTFFRVVTWAPTSEGRQLVGYFDTLEEADESILFEPKSAGPQGGPASSYSMPAAAAGVVPVGGVAPGAAPTQVR